MKVSADNIPVFIFFGKMIDLLTLVILHVWLFFDLCWALLVTTYWIDVCQSNGNLLASGGEDHNVKVFDKREVKIVRTFDDIHYGRIF